MIQLKMGGWGRAGVGVGVGVKISRFLFYVLPPFLAVGR